MGKLIYSAITSLDGYVVDADGSFDWAAPDREVHAFANSLEGTIGTHLYGRRMYEVMRYWETAPITSDTDGVFREYAEIWRAADKVVYSTSLEAVSTARTRLERTFDPDTIRALKESSDRDLSIGGPTLAVLALRSGLVDELHHLVNPVIVGGGTRWLPDGLRMDLQLLDEHRFAGGVVHLHYAT